MRFLFSRKGSSPPSSHHHNNVHVDQAVDVMAEAMGLIHLTPQSAKGYLMAGRTYVRQHKLQEALTIYNQGLIRVSHSNHGYERLERNAGIVAQEMKHQVTDKIISLVFGYLSEAELVQCTMVCTSWRRFLVEWPSFQTRIHAAFPQLILDAFKTPLQHLAFGSGSQQTPTTAASKTVFLSPASKKLLSMTSLTSLRLEHVFIPNPIVSSLNLNRIELVLVHLTQADLISCQHIPHVRVVAPLPNAFPDLAPDIIFHFQSLELAVHDHADEQMDKIIRLVRQSPDLVYLALDTTTANRRTNRRKSLMDHYFSNNNTTLVMTGTSSLLGPLLTLLQSTLEALYLDGVAMTTDESDTIPSVLPRLKTLECVSFAPNAVTCPLAVKIIEASPCLASVSFKGSIDVTDTVLDALWTNNQRQHTITHLQITAHPRFSPAGLMQLASRCPNLISVTLDFLHRNLVPVIRQWPSLRYLTLLAPSQHQGHHPHHDPTLVAQVRDLMTRRNGQLILVDDDRSSW